MNKKVLFIDSCHAFLADGLERSGFTCDHLYNLTEKEILEKIAGYGGAVIRSKIKFTKELLDKANELKFIARVGAGMENIDVVYAESKGIKCFHAPEGNRTAVAEHALGMLLMLANNLSAADREIREGKWIREGNRGWELEGKTIGIIGFGNMGSAFAQRLIGFGMNILAHDKYKKGFGGKNVNECPLESIQSEADIISLHLPLSDETFHYVNNVFINKCKKNFVLINTGRGKNVDTLALVKGLESGRIRGACLDVLEYEGTSFEGIISEIGDRKSEFYETHRYLKASDKVVLTPHIGGWTVESNEKMARVLLEKILSAFK